MVESGCIWVWQHWQHEAVQAFCDATGHLLHAEGALQAMDGPLIATLQALLFISIAAKDDHRHDMRAELAVRYGDAVMAALIACGIFLNYQVTPKKESIQCRPRVVRL